MEHESNANQELQKRKVTCLFNFGANIINNIITWSLKAIKCWSIRNHLQADFPSTYGPKEISPA